MSLETISVGKLGANPVPKNFTSIPSIDKSTHAWQRVFSVLFVLFALTGVSPPASQKPKITQKSIAVRCVAVLPEQKSVQAMKSPQALLYVLARALKRHGRFSARQNRVCPCQLMVSTNNTNTINQIFTLVRRLRHALVFTVLNFFISIPF